MNNLDLGIQTSNINNFRTLKLPITHEDMDPSTRFCARIEKLADSNLVLHLTIHGYSGNHGNTKTFAIFKEGISQLLDKFPDILSQAKEIHISGDWNLPLTVSQAEKDNIELLAACAQYRQEIHNLIEEMLAPKSGAIIQTAYAIATVNRSRSSRLSLSCQAHKKDSTAPKKDENLSYTCISKQNDPNARNIIINPIEDVVAKYTIPFIITADDANDSILWDHAGCILRNYQNNNIIGGVLNRVFLGVGPRGLYRGKVVFTPEQMLNFDKQMEQVIKNAIKNFINNIQEDELDIDALENIAITVTEKNSNLIKSAITMLFNEIFADPNFQEQRQILIEQGAVASISIKENNFYEVSFNDPNPQKTSSQCQIEPSEEEIKAAFVKNAIISCEKEVNVNKLVTNNLIAAFRLQPFAGFQAEQDIIEELGDPETSLEDIAQQLSTLQSTQLSKLLKLSGYDCKDNEIEQINFHIVETKDHKDYIEPLIIENNMELDNFIKQPEPRLSFLHQFKNAICNMLSYNYSNSTNHNLLCEDESDSNNVQKKSNCQIL